ncbi:MAG: diacylglycerol/lipid kinase family protein [Candidatus Hodarchaeales archaeon]|jgi:YegS/Rv2252/BmrU family lipid kinase
MTPNTIPSDLVTQEINKVKSKKREIFLVINPVAAGGRVESIWRDEIKPLVDSHDVEYDFEFTSSPQQAMEIARIRVNEGYKIICAVGGAGTANEVLNGILKAEKQGVFAAVPVGTGDDVPVVYGIPEGDLEAAVQCLVKGQNKTFDVGYCETADRYFASVASMGFDAEVADRTNKGSKRFNGTRRYQLALGKTLIKFRPYNLSIRIDAEQTIDDRKMLLAIGNGKRYGGGMHICPDAEVTDGKFAVTTVNKMSRITLLRFFSTIYDGNHLSHGSVDTFEGTHGGSIHVDSPKKKCLYQVDGEIMGYLPETFITKANHLTVRVPTPWLSYTEIWKKTLDEKRGFNDPWTGKRLLLGKLMYLNPISNFKRGLTLNHIKEKEIEEEQSKDEIKNDDRNNLNVKEKHFSKRVIFFLFRTFFQTVSLSVAFTAPITFPWVFDIVLPKIIFPQIPPQIRIFINDLIVFVQSLFAPLVSLIPWFEPLIKFFMDMSAIFNPFLVFSIFMIVANRIGMLSDADFQDPFKSLDTGSIQTSTGYFLESIRSKFSFDFSQATVLLLVVSSFVSFFLVIRRARGILYEVMTTKEEIKHLQKVRKVFLKYCKEGTYSDINYSKNRLSESPKTKVFANLVKYGPMVSMIIPALLAIFFILF